MVLDIQGTARLLVLRTVMRSTDLQILAACHVENVVLKQHGKRMLLSFDFMVHGTTKSNVLATILVNFIILCCIIKKYVMLIIYFHIIVT